MEQKIVFDSEGVASNCPISDIGTVTLAECLKCDWCIETDGVTVTCEREEDEPKVDYLARSGNV